MRRAWRFVFSLVAVSLASSTAHAEDVVTLDAPAPKHAEERPFVYALDPTTPTKGDASLEVGVGLASGVAADRPLPGVLGYHGAVHSVTFGYGVTERVAPFVSARVLQPSHDGRSAAGGSAGFRFQLTDPASAFRFTIAAAGTREVAGAFGAWGVAAASYDLGRMRVVGNVRAERAFASGRDGLDVIVVAGASYRASDSVRVGAEYVGQDLEESASGPEGGAKHYAGPTLAIGAGGFQLALGPAFGIGRQSGGSVLGRFALVASF